VFVRLLDRGQRKVPIYEKFSCVQPAGVFQGSKANLFIEKLRTALPSSVLH
jgi:hypothetical protein